MDKLKFTVEAGQEVYTFLVKIEELRSSPRQVGWDIVTDLIGWTFKVSPEKSTDSNGGIYDGELMIKDQNCVRMQSLHNGLHDKFKGIGLTKNFIIWAAAYLQMFVCSSSNLGKNEIRSDKATKAWQKLVDAGLARYEVSEDRFYYDFTE